MQVSIRKGFINFMLKHGHEHISSIPVLPTGSGTFGSYFVNSGLFRFRERLCGLDKSKQTPPSKSTNCQRCIRLGGKHNDLEDAGRDNVHHSSFEMLGTWSFDSYDVHNFAAVAMAYLTEELGLEKQKMVATYFDGEDDLDKTWRGLGVTDVKPLKENWWSMGDLGPCGPCTEIHYPLVSGELVELWNMVDIKYYKYPDALHPLHAVCGDRYVIDTGMGLERLCAIAEGVKSTFETGQFVDLIKATATALRLREVVDHCEDRQVLQVIADHARTVSWMMADGLRPSTKGPGYVCKKLIERCLNLARQRWDSRKPFLYQLCKHNFDDTTPEVEYLLKSLRQVEDRYLSRCQMSRKTIKNYIIQHNPDQLSADHVRVLRNGSLGCSVPMSILDEEAKNLRLCIVQSSTSLAENEDERTEAMGDQVSTSMVERHIPVMDCVSEVIRCGLLVKSRDENDVLSIYIARLKNITDMEAVQLRDALIKIESAALINVELSDDGFQLIIVALGEKGKAARKRADKLRQRVAEGDALDQYIGWQAMMKIISNELVSWLPTERQHFMQKKPSEHSVKKAIMHRLKLEGGRNGGQLPWTFHGDVPLSLVVGGLQMLDVRKDLILNVSNGQQLLVVRRNRTEQEKYDKLRMILDGRSEKGEWMTKHVALLSQ